MIDKARGYKVFKTIGSATDPNEIERLVLEAHRVANSPHPGQLKLMSLKSRDTLVIETFARNLSNAQIRTLGPELIFGTLFDQIGFSAVGSELFRHLVVARLSYPTSKLKTVDYLYRYQGIQTSKDKIYRFLDDLCDKYKRQVENISYQYTKKTLGSISVVFYDMTTLYFEAEDEDDLRKIGFSKDGKFQKPQIMLGLLVGERGLPISYNIYQGNTFEGHTLIPALENIQGRYSFNKPVVVADAALLSKANLKNLSKQKYRFIIGARIKNESDLVKQEILKRAKGTKDARGFSIKKTDGTRLVVTYSDKRSKKDAYLRKRGLRKLHQKVKSGRLTKTSINNRGYNKFLALEGEIRVTIDEEKVEEDRKWDGLKGYITNTKLSPKTITQNYNHLWQIEKAFRISKTDLRIRPIFHYRKKRIEAHICISFVAYTIYKELERLLIKHKAPFSLKRAAELTHNMYELEYTLPKEERMKILLKMDEEQKLLYDIIHNYP